MNSQQVVLIFKALRGTTFEYCGVFDLDAIRTAVAKQFGLPRNDFRLITNNKNITKIGDIDLTEGKNVIYVMENMRGGSSAAASLTDFSKGCITEKVTVAPLGTPIWAGVRAGLNVEYSCDNPDCTTSQYGGHFYSHMLYGKFSADAFINTSCSSCTTPVTKPFVRMIFTGPCEYTIKGLAADMTMVDTGASITDPHTINRYEPAKHNATGPDDKTTVWRFLNVIAYQPLTPTLLSTPETP